ncbi:hypothetical protein [Mycolicibacterium sp.]|uniref:hypothetical protein n=1 Tax=Mycolicibacterium sp. TaxID=2320850 RepID=UPI0037C62372
MPVPAAARGVFAAADTAAGGTEAVANSVERRLAEADGAKCPTARRETALSAAGRTVADATVDLGERLLAATRDGLISPVRPGVTDRPVAPTVGPFVLWLDAAEPPFAGSARAIPVPTVRNAQTPTVKTPAPNKVEASP